MDKYFDNTEPGLFDLDVNRLDEEWVRQPALYHEHAMILADARQSHEQKKAELEVLAAEIDRDVRTRPSAFGLEKITEAVVANTVLIQPPYRLLQKEVIEAKHNVAIAESAVAALDHRKKALENLVQLRLSDYFSEPRAKGPAREVMNEDRKRRIRSKGREDE